MGTSIFEALGGNAALAAAVDGLYERLLSDPVTASYFHEADIGKLRRHLRMFLAAALGGPDIYRGRDMRSAHAHLGITAQAWDRTVGHVAAVLAGLGVEDELAGLVIGHLAPLRDQIVTTADPVAALAA